MIQQLINRYKRMRTERYLNETYRCQYAFVGMGQHSLTNLYPVLHLQVPLKYICVTSDRKARLIERKFKGKKATSRLDDILNDGDVKGVLVAASPNAHFSIASRVLQSGKSLFIEKPSCQSVAQLRELIAMQQASGSRVAMVGLQQRYAPAVQKLQRRLKGERHLLNYDLHYLTGAYPEGDALLDLYIHPIDLATWLFGKAEIVSYLEIDQQSYILMLRHQHIVGTIELSTCHTWQDARQSLTIHTHSGTYHLNQCEELSYVPRQRVIAGIPTEKLLHRRQSVEFLYRHDGFSPTLAGNSIYSQGFFL